MITRTKRIPVTELTPGNVLVENGDRRYGVTDVARRSGWIVIEHDFGQRRIPVDRHVWIEA
jgi:hypothetical protein